MNGTTEREATEPQLRYINSLLEERDLPPDALERAKARLAQGLTLSLASQWIQKLQTFPKKDAPHGTYIFPDRTGRIGIEYQEAENQQRVGYLTGFAKPIPRGSYALMTPDAKNETTFYRLWIGDRGGWRLYLLHGPDRTELGRKAAINVLGKIAENPAEAASRYGLLIGACGICNRRLTNDESRARGIGPVCAERFGW